MRHAAAATSVFSARQRRTLVAVAEAAFPAGRVFQSAGEATIDRAEPFYRNLPEVAAGAMAALLTAFDAEAFLRHGRGFATLDLDARLHILLGWREGGLARRSAMRALLSPVGAAHYDNAAFYQHVGCVYTAT